MPAMTVTSNLQELLRQRFARPACTILQPLEPYWRASWRRRPARRCRILVTSPFEIYLKGVETALQAIRLLRADGFDCSVVRISAWPLCEAERELLAPDEFHCHVRPEEAARIVRTCDLHLAPSWEEEGFGLPVLESMACGVPVVAADIASFRTYATPAAQLVRFDDAPAFAAMAKRVLTDRGLWRRMRRDGLRSAARFEEHAAADSAEQALQWVASGAWRADA
jgi:glycosyltransferase involved in cell wall biosynthesis